MVVMDGVDSDLSDGVLTGGFFYPLSHALVKDAILFWPRKTDNAVMFMDWADGAPSAVSRIGLYELRGALGGRALHEPPGNRRLIGHQWEDPSVQWSYGSTRLPEQSISETIFFGGLEHIAQYLSHTGQNVWKYPIIWYWGPHYPSREEPAHGMGAEGGSDWVQVLLTLFEDYGISYYPSVTLLRLGSLMNDAVIDEEAVRRGADTYNTVLKSGGVRSTTNDWTRENDPSRPYPPGPIFNPVHPRVQNRILAVVREIADRYGNSPALRGLSFNIWVTCILWFHSLDNGYDDYTVGLFERETGTRVPVDARAADRFTKRHAYLTTTARNTWIEWRCRKVHQMLMKIRDILRNRRPDLRLGISCWPWYVRTSDRPPGEAQQMGRCPDTYELLRAGGLDLKMFVGEPNVDLELQFTPQHDRVWDKPNQDPAMATYRDFDFLDDATYAIFRRGGRNGVWMYNAYFETFQVEKPLPGWWFGEEMLNHPGLLPTGKYFMEHYAQALAAMDVKCLTRGGVGMATIGHDADVRDFARAFRALPAEPFDDVPTDSDLVVARQLRSDGMHYLYLVNRHNVELAASVLFSTPPAGLRDLGSGAPIATHGRELAVRLPAFSLRSFAMPSSAVAVERCAVDVPRKLVEQIESAAARVRDRRKAAPPGMSREAADRLLADLQEALGARRYFRAYHLLQSYDALRLLK